MPRNILSVSFLKLTVGRMLRVGVLSAILSGLILQAPSNALVDAGGGGGAGKTLVPVRASIEDRGGTVAWDAKAGKVTTILNGNTVEMWIGNPKALVNGVSTWIDETNHSVAPKITDSRTMLPASFIEKNCSSDKPGSTAEGVAGVRSADNSIGSTAIGKANSSPTIPKAAVQAQSSSKTGKANSSPTIPKAAVQAQSSSNMTDVAIRAIVEASGGTAVWDAKTGKVTTIVNGKTIEMWIGNPVALVNKVPTYIDETNHSVAPKITDSRTMLPASFIAQNYSSDKPGSTAAGVAGRSADDSIGSTADVAIRAFVEASGGTVVWDAKAGKVTTILNGTTIEMWIGNPVALVNKVPTYIDETDYSVAPKIIDSRTVLPASFIAQNYSSDKPGSAVPATVTGKPAATPAGTSLLSPKGLNVIAGYEGLGGKVKGSDLYIPYDDGYGHLTIGYGHLIGNDPVQKAEYKNGITKEDALKLLKEDTKSFAEAVKKDLSVTVTQAQLDALISFAYNNGLGAVKDLITTVINPGKAMSVIEKEWKSYCHVHGEVCLGLVNRRAAEWKMFSTA